MSNKDIADMLIRIATEELAKLEHEQWSHWMEFLNKNRSDVDQDRPGFNSLQWDRWLKQAKTPYRELTEEEKESDRQWARKALATLGLTDKEIMKGLFASQITPLNVPEESKGEKHE